MKIAKSVFALILILCCMYMAAYAVDAEKNQQRSSELAATAMICPSNPADAPPKGVSPSASPPLCFPKTSSSLHASEPQAPSPLFLHYAQLHALNPDFIGWVSIEGTPIDYPVMYTPKDPEYYLHRNFDRQASFAGTPFLDARCSLDADNLILHGHNMRNGSMFAAVRHYLDEAFFFQHPLIRFDTLDCRRLYRIFAVIPIQLGDMNSRQMYSYSPSMTQDRSQIEALRQYVKAYSEHCRLDALPDVGGSILTLSTCTGFRRANRLVIMAACIDEKPLYKAK